MAGLRPAGDRRAARREADSPRPDERGETLVELIVTVLVIGIAIVGLVGALGASIRFSTSDRAGANAESVLTSLVEKFKGSDYVPCGGAGSPALPAPPTIPGGTVYWAGAVAPGTSLSGAFLANVDSIRYWNGQTSPAGFQATCPVTGDPGLQEVTLRVWSADLSGGTEQIGTTVGQRLTFYWRDR